MSYFNLLGNDAAFRGCVCAYCFSLLKFNCIEETAEMDGKYTPEVSLDPHLSEKKLLTAFRKTTLMYACMR